MFKKIKNWFMFKFFKKEVEIPKIFFDTKNNMWGHCISWNDYPYSVYGFLDKVKEGDVFKQSLKSGHTVLFRLINVERPGNPSDMFFADCEFVGYVDYTEQM